MVGEKIEIKIVQERVSSIKRILRRNFKTRDTGIALLLVPLVLLVIYVISGLVLVFITYVIPPSTNIVSILAFLIAWYIFPAVILVVIPSFSNIISILAFLIIWYIFLMVILAIIFVVVKLIEKVSTKKLSGFWIANRKGKISMGASLREMKKIRQIRKPLRDSNSTDKKEPHKVQYEIKKYFVDSISKLLSSSKIEPCEIYSTETHDKILSLSKKRIPENIVILCRKKTKKKYLTSEYIMVWGIKKWLRLYFGNGEEPSEDIYKQFYLVKFMKIPETSLDCDFECCANHPFAMPGSPRIARPSLTKNKNITICAPTPQIH
jgi:hypothetical protein